MNEIQLSFALAKDLLDVTTRGIPDVQATVQEVSGNMIFLTTVPSATADMFFGGAMEVLTGQAQGLRTAIVESGGNTVVVSGTFGIETMPSPGDTVRLYGGPLAQARIYLWEPQTVKDDSGCFRVTVNTVSTRLTRKTFGKVLKGWLAFCRTYDYEVVAEAPVYTGDGNDLSSVRDALYDLKVLKEQCEIMAVNFRQNEQQRIYGNGPIDATYLMIQRTGSDQVRHAACIEFSIETR